MTKAQIWKLFYGSIAPLKVTREAALRGELNDPTYPFPKDGYLVLGAKRDEKTVYCQDSWTDPSTYIYAVFNLDDATDHTDWVLARPEEKKLTAHSHRSTSSQD